MRLRVVFDLPVTAAFFRYCDGKRFCRPYRARGFRLMPGLASPLKVLGDDQTAALKLGKYGITLLITFPCVAADNAARPPDPIRTNLAAELQVFAEYVSPGGGVVHAAFVTRVGDSSGDPATRRRDTGTTERLFFQIRAGK